MIDNTLTGRRLPLNAYLLRSRVTPSHFFSDPAAVGASYFVEAAGQLSPLEDDSLLAASQEGDIVVALLQRPFSAPNWQLFIREALNQPTFGGGGAALGAAIFCAVPDPGEASSVRWVSWCFGSASRAVRRAAVDPRFGLVIALNWMTAAQEGETADAAVARRAGRLRQLQYRTPSPYTQQTGHRAARDTPVEGFRVDRMVDVVSAVGGRAVGGEVADQVFGSRSLRFRATIRSLDDLFSLANTLVTSQAQHRYQRDFGWVGHYVLVDDEQLVPRLEQLLVDALVTDPDSIDALLPDDLIEPDDDRVIHFIVFPGERTRKASDTVLSTEAIARHVRSNGPAAIHDNLRFLDTARQEVGTATMLECLAADLLLDGERYVAYDGDFFRVDGEFLRSVDERLLQLPKTRIDLGCWNGDPEGLWNESLARARPDDFICLDRELIRLEGETPFESCDLVASSGALIHVKRKGKSSKLTYLFAQAERSCELLSMIDDARRQLRDLIAKATPDGEVAIQFTDTLAPLERRPSNVEVVFAILGDWRNRTVLRLPLVSKITLIEAARRIEQLGYRPSIALVGICGRPPGVSDDSAGEAG